MDFVPGPMSEDERRLSFRKDRAFILGWTAIVAVVTVVIADIFERSGLIVGGVVLGIVLFLLFAMCWLAPEVQDDSD